MNGIVILVFMMVALLGGMRIAAAGKWFKGAEEPLHRLWLDKKMYLFSLGYAAAETGLFLLGNQTSMEMGGSLVRYLDMITTYLLLTLVDIRKKIIPNAILLCYLAAQMLLMAAFDTPPHWFSAWIGGLVMLVLLTLAAWFSKGGLGLGDVKLLGITALTAGWAYTLQIVCLALAPSFIYSIWALAVCHKERRMEIPFVPFLLSGMMIQIGWQWLS